MRGRPSELLSSNDSSLSLLILIQLSQVEKKKFAINISIHTTQTSLNNKKKKLFHHLILIYSRNFNINLKQAKIKNNY